MIYIENIFEKLLLTFTIYREGKEIIATGFANEFMTIIVIIMHNIFQDM